MSGARARIPRRRVDGVLLLDKPPGITSQTAVSRSKTLFRALKAGHTGTLDPMATGLLPIAFGEATKFSSVLLDADKGYSATVRLGTRTTTGDLEGEVVETCRVEADAAAIESVLPRFRGDIVQTPPMYSALKHAGRPLYEYARAGEEIDRVPRRVSIRELVLESYTPPDFRLTVRCSKGTYVRVLAEDIGNALGCGACLAALRRTAVADFGVEDAVGFEALERASEAARDAWLLPVDAMLQALPVVHVGPDEAARIGSGQAVANPGAETGLVRLYAADTFLGLAEAAAGGALRPRRLVASNPRNG